MKSDSELIKLLGRSDYAAFEELHRRYWPKLQTIAYRKIGNRQDTFDLLQEMFIELWEKREILNFGPELGGWLQKRLWFKLSSYFHTKGFQTKHQQDFVRLTVVPAISNTTIFILFDIILGVRFMLFFFIVVARRNKRLRRSWH